MASGFRSREPHPSTTQKRDPHMREFTITVRPIAALKPYERNARTHSKKQIHQIAASIQEFGFINPVIIDNLSTILAGHGRVEAARSLGWTKVPTIEVDHLPTSSSRPTFWPTTKSPRMPAGTL